MNKHWKIVALKLHHYNYWYVFTVAQKDTLLNMIAHIRVGIFLDNSSFDLCIVPSITINCIRQEGFFIGILEIFRSVELTSLQTTLLYTIESMIVKVGGE